MFSSTALKHIDTCGFQGSQAGFDLGPAAHKYGVLFFVPDIAGYLLQNKSDRL